MILRGVVETGVGNFGFWIDRLHEHYRRKTGLALYPGTLNLRLDSEFDLPEERIRLEAHEYGGTVSVNIVPCMVFEREAVILRTDKNDSERGQHSRCIIEVATDIGLRETYGLRDGDRVEVTVPF